MLTDGPVDLLDKEGKTTAPVLRFTCPECGSHDLQLIYDCASVVQSIARVHKDFTVVVTGPQSVRETDGYGSQCAQCGWCPDEWERHSGNIIAHLEDYLTEIDPSQE